MFSVDFEDLFESFWQLRNRDNACEFAELQQFYVISLYFFGRYQSYVMPFVFWLCLKTSVSPLSLQFLRITSHNNSN